MDNIFSIIGIEALFLLLSLAVLIATTKRVDVLLKSVFVNRMQEFDYLIDERESKSEELTTEIEKKEQELKRIESTIGFKSVVNTKKEENVNSVIINSVDFEDSNVVEKYKNIKETLSFDRNQKILEFINKVNPTQNIEYDNYKRIRKYFTYDVIYRITAFDSETQKEIISELLTPEENEMVKEFMNQRFKINSFINKLDNKIVSTDYHVYVYTGNKNEKYEDVNPFVVTIYDKNITEGIKISYKGKIYDCSI